jgi:hypothetical protein
MNVPLQAAEFYRSQGFNGEGKIQKIGDMLQQRMRRAL